MAQGGANETIGKEAGGARTAFLRDRAKGNLRLQVVLDGAPGVTMSSFEKLGRECSRLFT